MIAALTTFSKFISITGSFATVGSLLTLSFLVLDVEGTLSTSSLKLKRAVQLSAGLWFLASITNILLTLANILGQSFSDVLDLTVIKSFIFQITLGQYLFFQTIVAFIILITIGSVKKTGIVALLFLLSLLGVIAPIFQSHSASSGSHALAIGSLVVHVLALTLWVGGLIALGLFQPEDRAFVYPRFSVLALWAVLAVVMSGSINAWARLDFASAWKTTYAFVVISKIILTIVLIGIGYVNRKKLLKSAGDAIAWPAFLQLVTFEVILMIITLALGAWLSSNQPPLRGAEPAFNAALSVAGISMPDAPTISRVFLAYDADVFVIGALIFAVALYVKGVSVLKARGDSWPIGRTISFALGIATIDFATSGGLGVYAHFSFSYHMVAHMVLGMIAPIGIVLGAPITLALRTLPQGRTSTERGIRGLLIAALHSRYARVLTNPIVALAIFDGSLFVLYFTSLFGGMMQSHQGHLFMNIHFILAGILFFHVIVGVDPNPRKVPHIVRIVILFAAMSIHAFFSIALMSTGTLIDQGYFASLQRPWALDLLADQHAGGAIGWGMGELPILIALVATFIQWVRDDSHETKRIDRNIERMAALGQPDDLAQYNVYLSELAAKDRKVEK
ncbi:unannotated protein [freshwater metagenome]|uniref:Unannotated protein n=1 Tax=freshwater metagenome TaxID=449393 RepID=A0A6J7XSY8_9ZZZZ|nr:hypothetical protein [Actinomycetota bacterium]